MRSVAGITPNRLGLDSGLACPVLLVQEGGDLIELLVTNLSAFLAGFMPPDPQAKGTTR